ncbi:hypothetical protein [Nocardia sp. alder85J]|uniref:hypothetical protein n=1 Tax=Nocardia sp. alder85J TaxID=2862949 RepID=UPI001CD499CB|nr:hypothetical protein [Nocardia sp. alder85J]MCX4095960.1 hypothetical protein [Nocardia sp. alder85J]
MDGSKAGSGERADKVPNRLNARVAGPAIAAGAVSLGLVMIGACGLGHQDTYVAPPPLNADLQQAPSSIVRAGATTTFQVVIPPSPSWRMALEPPRRRTESSTPPADAAGAPAAGQAPAEAAPPADNLAPSHHTTRKPTPTLQPAVTPGPSASVTVKPRSNSTTTTTATDSGY